jgi:hypothetical protein
MLKIVSSKLQCSEATNAQHCPRGRLQTAVYIHVQHMLLKTVWNAYRKNCTKSSVNPTFCPPTLKLNNFAKFERASKIVLGAFLGGRLKVFFFFSCHFMLFYEHKTKIVKKLPLLGYSWAIFWNIKKPRPNDLEPTGPSLKKIPNA